jgi:ABC-type transporter Mla MlaB component
MGDTEGLDFVLASVVSVNTAVTTWSQRFLFLAAINTISLDCNALATLQESAALTLRFLRRCV